MHISKPIIKTVEYFDKSNSLAQNSEKANDSYNMKVKQFTNSTRKQIWD